MAKRTYDPGKLYSPREIAQMLNNAVVYAMSPQDGTIPPERLPRLAAYTKAAANAMIAHAEEGYLRYEELVYVFSAMALMVQTLYVMADEKVPFRPTIPPLVAEKLDTTDSRRELNDE